MPEHTRPESSSPGPALDQSGEGTREEPSRELAGQSAKEKLTVEQKGRARVPAKRVRARPRGASIARPPSEIAKRAEERSAGPAPVPTSAEIASAEQSTARKQTVAAEIISATPPHSADAIAKLPAAVREITADEVVGSPEALPEESEEIKQTVTNEIVSRVPVVRWTYRSAKLPSEMLKTLSAENRGLSRLPSRDAVTHEAIPTERPAPWEIERKLQLEKGLQPTTEHAFARWRDALWEAVQGRLADAGWWRRVGRAVLNFLARFIPDREDPILRRSREIRELFRFLHEHEEPQKPGTWSNCPK
jgi:hypothetical protein